MTEQEVIAEYCIQHLDIENRALSVSYHYNGVVLCAIDTIYSIGVKYKNVLNVIDRFCKANNIENRHTIGHSKNVKLIAFTPKDFLAKYGSWSPEKLASELFQNKQRTSTRNGILKSDALLRVITLLDKYGIQDRKDFTKLNDNFKKEFKTIPGQSSGISLRYFHMLMGDDDMVKPDRMIMRFIENVIERTPGVSEAESLLRDACSLINKKLGIQMTLKELDHLIWNYQRNK